MHSMGFESFVPGGWGLVLQLLLEEGKQHRVEVDRDRAWIGNSTTGESGSFGLACRAAGAWSSNCLSQFPPVGAPSPIPSPSL